MAMYYSMGVTQFASGVNGVKACANLQMLLGNLGVHGGGVNPLRGQSNVQGACDMGALPVVYPAYQPIASDDNRAKFAAAWKTAFELSTKPGLTIVESLNKVIEGQIKGLYIMGENPVISDPNQHHVVEALEKVEFLAVQDIVLTETAQYADVVFPATAFLEKEGTITNTERRVQLMHRVVEPVGESRDDWWIITRMANAMGVPWNYASSREIYDEMRSLTPSYAGMSYERIEKEALHWPCPAPDHPGTPFFTRENSPRARPVHRRGVYGTGRGNRFRVPGHPHHRRMLEHFHTTER
jgi:predicted molibdopterin-dependent oxidoreductase YjgC